MVRISAGLSLAVAALLALSDLTTAAACAEEPRKSKPPASEHDDQPAVEPEELQTATFGMGCFWCSEAVFQQLKGVASVVPGYSGGVIPNPNYAQVSSGLTGHAEVVQIKFDPAVISYEELLEVFWKAHDPTSLNWQDKDEGTQYRSVIFYHNDRQQEAVEEAKRNLEEMHTFRRPIVTEIVKFTAFYPAEEYHQNYFNRHPYDEYSSEVIRPKVGKVKKKFRDKLRDKAKRSGKKAE